MINKINHGGTAFPTVDEHRQNYGEQGMTLRQYYAVKAMQGIITTCQSPCIVNGLDGAENEMAKSAFKIADAMLKFEQDEQS
jgi:hypothetical protein